MIKNILIASIAIAGAVSSHASTVNWQAAVDTVLLASNVNNTTTLPLNSVIRLGYFSLSDGQILGFHNAADLTSLDAAFVQYDFVRSGEGTDNTEGTFAKASARADNLNGNLQMYLWVLQATNNTSVATALATATAQSIFYVDKAINPQWTFGAAFNSVSNIDIGDLTVDGSGAVGAGGHLVVGNVRPNVNRPDLQAAFGAPRIEGIQAAAIVPEPSSVFMIAAGAVGLFARRRRQA